MSLNVGDWAVSKNELKHYIKSSKKTFEAELDKMNERFPNSDEDLKNYAKGVITGLNLVLGYLIEKYEMDIDKSE